MGIERQDWHQSSPIFQCANAATVIATSIPVDLGCSFTQGPSRAELPAARTGTKHSWSGLGTGHCTASAQGLLEGHEGQGNSSQSLFSAETAVAEHVPRTFRSDVTVYDANPACCACLLCIEPFAGHMHTAVLLQQPTHESLSLCGSVPSQQNSIGTNQQWHTIQVSSAHGHQARAGGYSCISLLQDANQLMTLWNGAG